jgi:hypothetical protein
MTLAAATASATVLDANPSNYQSLLARLTAGDVLRLAAGTYTKGLTLAGIAGTAAQPITVQGPDDQSAAFIAIEDRNTVQLESCSYLRVLNLSVSGGVDSRGVSHHITLENLKIAAGLGATHTDGISARGPAWNWTIRHNTISGAEVGLHLGSAAGDQPFVAGVIEYNLVLDSVAANLKIERQLTRPTDIGLPDTIAHTIIRHNVFARRDAPASGELPQASVQLDGTPNASAEDLYEMYGNFLYRNPSAPLLQAVGALAVHDNLFVNPEGDAIDIDAQENGARNVTVYHNTILASGTGLRISGEDAAHPARVIANISFAAIPIFGPHHASNVTGAYESAGDSLNAPFAPPGSLDLLPKTARLASAATDLTAFAAFTDGTKDFNGVTRNGWHPGAYEGEGPNPGWHPALSIKSAADSAARLKTLAAAAPTLTMSASPASVPVGGTSLITWNTTGIDGCSASGGWTGSKPANGSETVGPLQSTMTFQLTCLGGGGNAGAMVQVTVGGTTPPSTDPPTTTPPPSNPPQTDSMTASKGGGGVIDTLLTGVLILLTARRRRRSVQRAPSQD